MAKFSLNWLFLLIQLVHATLILLTFPTLAWSETVSSASDSLAVVASDLNSHLAENLADGASEDTMVSEAKREPEKVKDQKSSKDVSKKGEAAQVRRAESNIDEERSEEGAVKISDKQAPRLEIPERPKRDILGWIEKAMILPYKVVFDAKLDTGADFSSINATEVDEFERDGKQLVSFTVTKRYGDEARIESPVLRVATIKGHHRNQKRLVIELGLCVNSTYMKDEVNLVNRSKFDYQMLIGRSFLAGKAFIDPASAYLSDPRCSSS